MLTSWQQTELGLFVCVGLLAITNALMPNGSWRSISLIMGVISVVRALLN